MVWGTPAAVNAWSRYLRSWVSQRTEDFVSGSRTATLPALLPPLELLLLLDDLSLSSLPHPATAKARTARAAAIPATKPGERLIIGEPPPPGATLAPVRLPPGGRVAGVDAGAGPFASYADHLACGRRAIAAHEAVGFCDHERQRTEGLGASAELAWDDFHVARRARDGVALDRGPQ